MVTAILAFLGVGIGYSQNNPNWCSHVAPIIYKNCTPCHTSGGIAPIPLSTYEQTKLIGSSVVSATKSKYMPPFPANLEKRRYAHEMVLSPYEIDVIRGWHEAGYPLGDTSVEPPKPIFNSKTELPRVDKSYRMESYWVNTKTDVYRCFAIPTELFEDVMIKGLEVIPGDRRVVHHALIFQDTSYLPWELDKADPLPGYSSFGSTGSSSSELIGMYVPGQKPFIYPLNFASRLKKNSVLIIQIHYPPGVNGLYDSTRVNFMLEKETNQREVFIQSPLNHVKSLKNGPLFIEANTEKEFFNEFNMPANFSLIAVAPHMHLLGKSIYVNLLFGTDTIPIVHIPVWDFHWQMSYMFRNPIKALRGSKLLGSARYDNTTSNRNNPNYPPKDVRAGEGTADEMFLVYFWYTIYQTGDEMLELDSSNLKSLEILNKDISKVSIYPNPFDDELIIQGLSGSTEIRILSASGENQKFNFLENTYHVKRLSLSEIPPGVYWMNVISPEGSVCHKILKR